MGRITKLQNDIGHLQTVLATKNTALVEKDAEAKKLREQIAALEKRIAELQAPKAA